MKLSEWLKSNNVEPAEFAAQIGTHYQAVLRYCGGTRIPKRAVMHRIYVTTEGAVTPNDFYDLSPLSSRDQPSRSAA